MLSAQILDAFATMSAALAAHPELADDVCARWRGGLSDAEGARIEGELPHDLRAAAEMLGEVLPAMTLSEGDTADLEDLLAESAGAVLLSWCGASTWRRDVRLAQVLTSAAATGARCSCGTSPSTRCRTSRRSRCAC